MPSADHTLDRINTLEAAIREMVLIANRSTRDTAYVDMDRIVDIGEGVLGDE